MGLAKASPYVLKGRFIHMQQINNVAAVAAQTAAIRTAGIVGKKVRFALVESPLPQNGSGKAAALGKGLPFDLVQNQAYTFTVPVPGMDEVSALFYVRARVIVAASAAYDMGICSYAGVCKAKHSVPMTTWMWAGDLPVLTYDGLEAVVTVRIEGSFREFNLRQKLAGDGVKASVSPEPGIRLFDAFSEEDLTEDGLVLLTSETMKGKQAIASAAAEWWTAKSALHQFPVYDPNVGYTAAHMAIMGAYVRANTKLVDIVYPIEETQYDIFMGSYGSDPAWSFHGNGVVVHQCKALFGEMVLAIEYTSTFVNLGDSQEMIPEITYIVDAIHPELGESLWGDVKATRRRGAFQGLLNMLHQKAPDGAAVWKLDPLKGIKFRATMTDKELAEGLKLLYPNGVILVWAEFSQYVDLGSLLSIGAYAPGGEAYGFAHELMALLRYLHVDNEKVGDPTRRMKFHFRKFQASLKGTLAKSKKTLAKTIRVGKLFGRKVDGTYRRGMGLWEIHVNPNDYLVMAKKLKEGDVVLGFRIPVYNATAWKIVLDEQTPMGVFQVHPLCWHAANEGDFDGDGIAILPVPTALHESTWEKFHAAKYGGWRGYFTLRGADSCVLDPK